MLFNYEKQLKIGRSFQPTFKYRKILISFIGAFIAINILAVVCIYNDQSLLMHTTAKKFIARNAPKNDFKIFLYLIVG